MLLDTQQNTKACYRCEETKSIDSFDVEVSGHVRNICKVCRRKKAKEYNAKPISQNKILSIGINKKCVCCKEIKSIQSFGKRQNGSIKTECKSCISIRGAERRKNNPEKTKEKSKYYYHKNKKLNPKKAVTYDLNLVRCCSACGEEKMMKDFLLNKDGRRNGKCFECRAVTRKNWRIENLEYIREYEKRYNKNKPEVDRKRHLKKIFGITPEDFNKMFIAQDGKCKCCNRHQSEIGKTLVIDHCHATKKIRGLLCNNCNSALGFIKDSTNTLENMIKYLQGK